MKKIKYDRFVPCEHRGCLNHISHPCESCGRIRGDGVVYERDYNKPIICNFCSKDSELMRADIPHVFYGKVMEENDEMIVIYDTRGYLRLGNGDFNCLDHGEKIKINFCPMCGKKL